MYNRVIVRRGSRNILITNCNPAFLAAHSITSATDNNRFGLVEVVDEVVVETEVRLDK